MTHTKYINSDKVLTNLLNTSSLDFYTTQLSILSVPVHVFTSLSPVYIGFGFLGFISYLNWF